MAKLANAVTPGDLDKGKYSKIDEIVQEQIIQDFGKNEQLVEADVSTYREAQESSRSPTKVVSNANVHSKSPEVSSPRKN